MKITKRILAVLALIALLVSCMLLSVSAEETFKAEGISNIEDILEYYAYPSFVADNYETGEPDSLYYSGNESEVVLDPANESNKALKVTAENNSYKVNVNRAQLIVSFDILYDASMQGEYRVNLKTVDADGNESITFTTLLSVNAAKGKIQYSVWDADLNNFEGGFVLTDFDGVSIKADTWYKIIVFFDAEVGTYSFNVLYTDEENKSASVVSEDVSLGNVKSMTQLVLKSFSQHRGQKIFMYLDNVEVYTGTFLRNPANRGYVTAQTFLDLAALYEAEQTDLETKVRIAKVFEELCLSGKYVPEFTANEENGVSESAVNAVNAKIAEYVNVAFANYIIEVANSIDVEAGYADRVAHLSDVAYYENVLPVNEALATAPGFDEELVGMLVAAREAISAEKALCEQIAADSAAFIEKMYKYDDSNRDYDGYIKPFYEEALTYKHWDITYPGTAKENSEFTIIDAVARYEAFEAKYSKIVELTSTFISGATEMKNVLSVMDEAEEKMKAALNAYKAAEANMNAALEIMNGINIEDESLDDATKALYAEQEAIYNAQKAIYDEQTEIYAAQKAVYEESFATLANGYTLAKSVYNDGDIDENLDENTYADLVALFEVYLDNEDFVIEETVISNKFIEIVKNAEIATYYTSKVERLTEAEQYVDNLRLLYTGVAEALAKYNELKADIAAQEKAAADYIAAVAEIANAQTHADRKAAVEAATLLKESGDVLGIVGVKEANMLLSEAAAKIETEAVNSANLIALVSEIENVRDFLSRRALISKAQNAADNSDDTIEGVTDAKAALVEFINEYTAKVNEMNATHAASTEKAADLMSSAASNENVYKATNVIKDFVNG